MSANWLERSLVTGPFLCLALSPDAFHAALEDFGVPVDERGQWLMPGFNACVQTFRKGREVACIVSIADHADEDPIMVAGLLVHEAVHVWQTLTEIIGEASPSVEFEAYTIQRISMRLMQSYAEQMGFRSPM